MEGKLHRMFKTIAPAVVLFLAACSTTPLLVATGGSRADATVEMGYEYGGFDIPTVDLAEGAKAAEARCRAWGYKRAEPFGGEQRQCNAPSQYGCARWFAKITYQCIG